jgi:hypothetical protein
MLAGLLVVSLFAGGLASGTALAMAFPLWVAVLVYPLGGTAGLLLGAAATLMPRLAKNRPQEIPSRIRA